jgi:transcriptional regulator with XRE-family HTH domain
VSAERPIDVEIARIGQRIRRWREQADLTLHELAQKSGLATSTVQKVEKGQMIPSVAVLLKIARGFGRSATELIHEGSYRLDVAHLRASERHPVGAGSKMLVERLSADLTRPALEMWRVTLHPGISSGSEPIEYDGEEIVVCEQGCVTFVLGEEEHELATGDTLHFKATIPHFWRNDGDAVARFTVTGTLPEHFRAVMRGRLAGVAGG